MSQVKKEIKTIKQQIISVLILFFAFVMIFSTVNMSFAAENTTTLAQNIIAGALDMTAPSTLDFTNVNLNGSQQNSNTNLNDVNVTDYRGEPGTGWNLTAYSNNLVAGTNNIDVTARLNVTPGQGANVTSDKNAQAGSAFMMPNSAPGSVLMNASPDNGTGVSNITNSLFKLNVESTDVPGEYTATLTLTVSS